MFLQKHRFMAPEGEAGGGGAAVIEPPAPAPAPAPAEPPAPSPAPAAAAPSPAPSPAAAPAEPPAPAQAPVAPKWPDSWRDLMAGTVDEKADDATKQAHEKMAALLKRYNTPADVAKALRAAQVKISDGTLKTALPKDATPEQIAQWRTENGIPETPEGYKLEDGLVLGDADKPVVDGFLKAMHAKNAAPELVNESVKWFLANREAQIAAQQERDAENRAKFEDELRSEWGNDYRPNLKGVETMVGQWPEDVRTALLSARTADGFLMENPGFMRAIASMAREMGYVGGTLITPEGDLGKGIEAEIEAIEKSMFDANGARSKEYMADLKKQERYAQLLAARDRRAK